MFDEPRVGRILVRRRRIRDGGLRVRVGDLVAIGAGENFEELKRVESDEEANQWVNSFRAIQNSQWLSRYGLGDVRLPQLGLQREGICPIKDAGVDVEQL